MGRSSGPVRRGQLIAPFGVGAMMVVRGGTSIVVAGLDYWFDKSNERLDLDEFLVEEWRLASLLKVSKLLLPPDYRKAWLGKDVPNAGLTIPCLRFPQWHTCNRCGSLEELPLDRTETPNCLDCSQQGFRSQMRQVRFVAMCDHGHLQDFPWREWVHRTAEVGCPGRLKLKVAPGAALAAQNVVCECGRRRNLQGITTAGGGTSYITSNLLGGDEPYFCRGRRPWLGTNSDGTCTRPLQGSLRSASNLHFPVIKRSIFIPQIRGEAEEALEVLNQPAISSRIEMISQLGLTDAARIADTLVSKFRKELGHLEPETILVALEGILSPKDDLEVDDDEEESAIDEGLKRQEFAVLKQAREQSFLTSEPQELTQYEPSIEKYFSSVVLVNRLKETRAFCGFTRVNPEPAQKLQELRQDLWEAPPPEEASWLPAYEVFGEGIFLEFNESELRDWESRNVQIRVNRLRQNLRTLQRRGFATNQNVSARKVLIHTVSHLLMNQLIYDCGYSSASLCERLYVSDDSDAPMAGVLIYTAAGDSEGTLGGLVRMGKAGAFESVLRRALEGARWCSADPICMELGKEGQGPDSCNLAACHSCTLVPETACEEFNRLLDRGLVVGSIEDPAIGYFSHYLNGE